MYRTDESTRLSRKRTYSENYDQQFELSALTSTMTLNRVQSEGDLSRIDRKKTFKAFDDSNQFQTKDLLTNILTALGSMELRNDDELSSAKTQSHQSLAQSDDSCTNRPVRQRAFSDFYIPQQDACRNSNDLTWNGNNDPQIQEYLKNRPKKFSVASIFASKSESRPHSEPKRQNTLQVPGEASNRSFISKINPFKARTLGQQGKRHSVACVDPQTYLNKTARGRESQFSLSQAATENMELLETTTIADLIRAIEEVQTKSTPLLGDHRRSERTKPRKQSTSNIFGLQVPTNGSRRGSLRPIPTYTTVFSSQNAARRRNSSSNLDRETTASTSTLNKNPTKMSSTPNSTRRILPNASPPSHILRRTFSSRPSPLATSSNSASNVRTLPETPTISVQPPNVTISNVLWQPDSAIADHNVNELRNRGGALKRADSK